MTGSFHQMPELDTARIVLRNFFGLFFQECQNLQHGIARTRAEAINVIQANGWEWSVDVYENGRVIRTINDAEQNLAAIPELSNPNLEIGDVVYVEQDQALYRYTGINTVDEFVHCEPALNEDEGGMIYDDDTAAIERLRELGIELPSSSEQS